MYVFVKYSVDVSVAVRGCVRACNPLKGGLHAHNTQPERTHVQDFCTLKGPRLTRAIGLWCYRRVQSCADMCTGRKRGVHIVVYEIQLTVLPFPYDVEMVEKLESWVCS